LSCLGDEFSAPSDAAARINTAKTNKSVFPERAVNKFSVSKADLLQNKNHHFKGLLSIFPKNSKSPAALGKVIPLTISLYKNGKFFKKKIVRDTNPRSKNAENCPTSYIMSTETLKVK
jgi:hypothetical protein